MFRCFVLICVVLFSSLEAQRVYPQSTAVGGNVVTNYYYDYLPGTPNQGRPYRQNGKIKYQPLPGRPNYYPNYYYNPSDNYPPPQYSAYPQPGGYRR